MLKSTEQLYAEAMEEELNKHKPTPKPIIKKNEEVEAINNLASVIKETSKKGGEEEHEQN